MSGRTVEALLAVPGVQHGCEVCNCCGRSEVEARKAGVEMRVDGRAVTRSCWAGFE